MAKESSPKAETESLVVVQSTKKQTIAKRTFRAGVYYRVTKEIADKIIL